MKNNTDKKTSREPVGKIRYDAKLVELVDENGCALGFKNPSEGAIQLYGWLLSCAEKNPAIRKELERFANAFNAPLYNNVDLFERKQVQVW